MTTARSSSLPGSLPVAPTTVLRAVCLMGLLALELFALLRLFLPSALPESAVALGWMAVLDGIKTVALSVFSWPVAVAFCILNWTRLRGIAERWVDDVRGHTWQPWLFANIAIFALVLPGAFALNAQVLNATTAPWGAFALWFAGVIALFLTLAVALAPVRYWTGFVRTHFATIMLAIAAGVVVTQLMAASQQMWAELAGLALQASAWILRLYEADVRVEEAAQIIRVGDFSIYIDRSCSGYEGMGLVAGFLSLFVYAFRKDLRFPNVLLIIPIGVVAIWLLNVLRIAILVSIGAHISPALAVDGFHSYAGWVSFLAVSISLMFVTYRIGYFRTGSGDAPNTLDPGVRLACAYLLPFIAIMAAGIIAKLLSVEGQPLYALTVAAACAAMWPFRDIYWKLVAKPQMVSVLAGLAIGAGWIVTDPGRGTTSALGLWLDALPAWLAISWICVRVVGSTVFVPIAEELAFRGYLHRALIARRFESVAPGQFTWLAFLVSTALFALMHERWLAAAIAGAAYAIVMYRTNRISDAIVAHMSSNALIAAWAIIWGQWSLL